MRLAADGEPPIVSANKYCDGSVSIDLDYLDGQPDFLGEYSSLEEAEKHHKVTFIYPVTLQAKQCNGSCDLVGHADTLGSSKGLLRPICPTCLRPR